MSETTAEQIVENHAKHIRQLTVEEVGTETLDALCRDAVQAAVLLGVKRGKESAQKPRMMEYGWSVSRIVSNDGGSVLFAGGYMDGLSRWNDALADAKAGEEWLVEVVEEQPWGFGKTGRAVRLTPPANEPQPDSPSDEFFRDMLGKDAEPVAWSETPWIMFNEQQPNAAIRCEIEDGNGGCHHATWSMGMRCWDAPTLHGTISVRRWRPIPTGEPEPDDGEMYDPEADLSPDLSPDNSEAGVYKRATDYWHKYAVQFEKERDTARRERDRAYRQRDDLIRQRDELRTQAENDRGECAELHRILETIRRVADSKP